MPPHVKARESGMYYLIDGKVRKSLKTRDPQHAAELVERYTRNKLGIIQLADLSESITAVFREYGLADSITTMRQLRFPCVYAFVRDGEVVYVGSTINGFARVLASHHPMTNARDSDQILF